MRKPSDPTARLERLEVVLKELGRKSPVFNLADMAEVLGMTARNFRLTIDKDPDLPIRKRGGEGVPWEFEARPVVKHLIARAQAALADRERRRTRVGRLVGLGDRASVPPLFAGAGNGAGSGSAAEILEDARALSQVIDLQAKLRAEKVSQGLLLDRAETERFLWGWLSTLQAEVLAIEVRLDRAGRMEPAARQGLKDELASILVAMRTKLEEFIGPNGVSGPQEHRSGPRETGQRRVSRARRGDRAAGAGAAHPA